MAGSWYPASRDALEAVVEACLPGTAVAVPDRPRALVAPHAGIRYSGPVAGCAYGTIRAGAYRTVVLVGPSHYESFDGVSIWPVGEWDTPFGPVLVDEPLAGAIAGASPVVHERASAHAREHSLEMQMPFVARLLPDARIVPLVMGRQTRATAYALGDAMARAIGGSTSPIALDEATRGGVLLVASSDLSHYEDAATAAALDQVVIGHVEGLDPAGLMGALEREPRHACGGGPVVSVMRAAITLGAVQARVLRYADSGDVTGDKSSVVGYLAAALW